MLGLLLDFVRQAGAASESDTERNGFLSYSAETHAVGHGLFDGMRSFKFAPSELPDNSDVLDEPHYYKGAFVAGTVLQLVVLVAAALLGFL